MIYVIGIGPGGSKDYLTIKALNVIQDIDIAIYVGEMISKDIISLFKPKKILTGDFSRSEVLKILNKNSNRKIALLMPGDSSIYSGQINKENTLNEYIKIFKKNYFEYEIIPGISALNVLCSKYSIDLTSFETSQNIFITSANRLNDLNCLNLENLKLNLKTRPKVVLYQSYRDWNIIKALLINMGYLPNTRIIFAFKLSWEDELVIDTSLDNIDTALKDKNLSKNTIILILPYER